jgi:CspA family cold shock protein
LLAHLSFRRSTATIVFPKERNVATGTVKWFNGQKGLRLHPAGRRRRQGRVHISAVEKAGYDSLAEGTKVSFDVISDRGKESAGNLLLK